MKKRMLVKVIALVMVVSFVVPSVNGQAIEEISSSNVSDEGFLLPDIAPSAEVQEWAKENVKEKDVAKVKNLNNTNKKTRRLASEDMRELPDSVDLSKSDAFPLIGDQKSLGSCSSFTSIYYNMSYMVNKLSGRSGKDLRNIFSPKFIYNVLNEGENQGTYILENFRLAQEMGGVSLADYPYNGDDYPETNYREWCNNEQLLVNAQKYSISSINKVTTKTKQAPITNPKASGLKNLKTMLAKGYVLSTQTSWNDCSFDYLSNDPSTSKDDKYEYERVIKWRNGDPYSNTHAITVVGYDDNVWTDINGDGIVQEAEKGALKFANSWGSGWGNDGFFWVAYDALNYTSQVPNLPSECDEHTTFAWNQEYYWIEPTIKDKVNAYIKVKLRSPRRDDVAFIVDADKKDNNSETVTYFSRMLNENGGDFGFDGKPNESEGIYILDLDKIIPNIKPEEIKDYRWNFLLSDVVENYYGVTPASYEIVDNVNNISYINYENLSWIDGASETLTIN